VLGLGIASTIGIFGRSEHCEGAGPPKQSIQRGIAKIELALSLPVSGAATAVAWSADGSRLAAASNYGADLTVWDTSGHIISQFNRSGRGLYVDNSLCFADSGRLLVTPSAPSAPQDAALTIWDVATGKDIQDVAGPASGQPPAFNLAYHFVVSPDQKRIAIAPARNDLANVVIYDATSWKPLVRIPRDRGAASSFDFSPDSRWLAIGTFGGNVLIVDRESGASVATLRIFTSPVNNPVGSIAFSPDGTLLAAGGGAGGDASRVTEPVRVHSVADGSLIAAYQGARQPIWKLAWVLDGRALAFVSSDKTVRVWHPRGNAGPGTSTGFSPNLMSIAASPDGGRLAVTDDTRVNIYRLSPVQ
jgi:WD40 repeat protein